MYCLTASKADIAGGISFSIPRHCKRRKARGNPFSFKGETDSFTLRVQNDKPFCCLQIHKARGNPFLFLRNRERRFCRRSFNMAYSNIGLEVEVFAMQTQLLPGFTVSSLPSVFVNLKPFLAAPLLHLIAVYVPFTQ